MKLQTSREQMTRMRSTGTLQGLKPLAGLLTVVDVRAASFNPLVLERRTTVSDYSAIYKVCSDYQSITDEEHGKGKFNSCSHSKYYPSVMVVPSGHVSTTYPDSVFYDTSTWFRESETLEGATCLRTPESCFPNLDWPVPSLPSINWTEIVAAVGDKIDGRMSSSTNVLVTFGEALKTVKMIKNPFKTLRALSSKSTLKDVVKAASSSRLEYRYGWSQLYRDTVALASAYDKVKDHIAYLRETVGKDRHVSSSQVDETFPNTIYSDSSGVDFASQSWMFAKYHRRASFHMTHVVSDAVQRLSTLDHMLDQLGVKKLGQAVWDLVPYSFVVDWFLNFGQLVKLSALEANSFRYKRVGYSEKCSWTFHLSVDVNRPPLKWNGPALSVFWDSPRDEVLRTSYTRTSGFPTGTADVGLFGSLSKTNMADGAALILQRI